MSVMYIFVYTQNIQNIRLRASFELINCAQTMPSLESGPIYTKERCYYYYPRLRGWRVHIGGSRFWNVVGHSGGGALAQQKIFMMGLVN